MVDAAYRYQQWCDAPQNKERVNQAVDEISVYAQRGFKIWCWAIATTIETGYNSRPYVERAIAVGKEGITQATVLIRFLLGLRDWLGRLDHEEVEEYQLALPCSPSLALLAPAKVPQAWEDDPWIAPAKVAAIAAAPVTEDAAETPLLLAPAPAPKTAKGSKRRTAKTSGNRSRKSTRNGRKTPTGDRKSNTKAKVGGN